EVEIAASICDLADSDPINLGAVALNGGQLKALYWLADLVVTNDTGPRHIAIALDKDLITLFGPNNPKWTQTDHDKEDKPVCRQNRHLCMESITVDRIFELAANILEPGC
ncbi:MAG: glycosyltransferase family 9 protein, partial [Planctomycetota bacterium]